MIVILLVEEDVSLVALSSSASTMTASTMHSSTKLQVQRIQRVHVPVVVAFHVKLVIIHVLAVLVFFLFLHLVAVFLVDDLHVVVVVDHTFLVHADLLLCVHEDVVGTMVHVVLMEAIVGSVILVVLASFVLVLIIFQLVRRQTLVKHLLMQLVLVQVVLVILTRLVGLLQDGVAALAVLVIIVIRVRVHQSILWFLVLSRRRLCLRIGALFVGIRSRFRAPSRSPALRRLLLLALFELLGVGSSAFLALLLRIPLLPGLLPLFLLAKSLLQLLFPLLLSLDVERHGREGLDEGFDDQRRKRLEGLRDRRLTLLRRRLALLGL